MECFNAIKAAIGGSPSPTVVSEFPNLRSASPSNEESAVIQCEHIVLFSDSTAVARAVSREQMTEKSIAKYEGMPTFSSSAYHPDVTLKVDVKKNVPLFDDDDEESRVERHEAKKSNCLALINFEVENDPTILSSDEKQKLTFITSYVKQIGVDKASKLQELEQTIQSASGKASAQGDAFSFKKSLLNSFLIPKYDLPGDISKIDAENAHLLRTSLELHPEAVSSASKEFQDPYLQGNQANYSKKFLFVQSHHIGEALLPSTGKFQGGVPLREECERRAKSTILECFQKKGIDIPTLRQEIFLYNELLTDVGRSYMVLQDDKQEVVISGSQNDELTPTAPKEAQKIEVLTQFKGFVGHDHRLLGIAIGRMMNQTIMADIDTVRKLKTLEPGSPAQQQLQYPDKGLLYFQYIPSTGRKQETISHSLIKESETSFKVTSTLYQEGLLSSEHGEKDLLLQMNAQVSYRFSESSTYDPTKEMSLKNLPCHVECLDLATDYRIRETV